MTMMRKSNNNDAPLERAKKCGAGIVSLVALFLALSGVGCQSGAPTGATNKNRAANSSPAPKKDDFEEQLSSVKRAGFDFIFAFRRPDGEVLTGEDKAFLKASSPPETNQWRLTEDGKAVVAGSNYKFMPQHLDALRTRFAVEDHSKQPAAASTPAEQPGNRNSNANVK